MPSGPPARLGGRDPAAHDRVLVPGLVRCPDVPATGGGRGGRCAQMDPGPRAAAGERRPVRRLLRRHGPRRCPGLQRRPDRRTTRRASRCGATCSTGDFVEATFENWESRVPADGDVRRAHRVPLPARLVRVEADRRAGAAGRGPPRRRPSARTCPGRCAAAGRARAVRTLAGRALLRAVRPRIALHALGGARAYSDEQLAHGQPAVSLWHTSGRRSSGSSRSRTGSASSSPSRSSSARRSTCGSAAPPSRSRSPSRTTPPAPEHLLMRTGLRPMITGPSPQVCREATCGEHAAAMTSMVVIWYRVRHGARRGRCPCWICTG